MKGCSLNNMNGVGDQMKYGTSFEVCIIKKQTKFIFINWRSLILFIGTKILILINTVIFNLY